MSLQIDPHVPNQYIVQEQTAMIDLEDETNNYNLSQLIARKKGQAFWVKEGKLERLKGLANRVRYCSHRTERQQEVQKLVTQTIQALNAWLGGLGGVVSQPQHIAVQTLFMNEHCHLNRLSYKVFDRGAIEPGSHLEHLLSATTKTASALESRREALQKALQELRDSSKTEFSAKRRAVFDALRDLSQEEMEFSQWLGYELGKKPIGGSGGARLGRTRYRGRLFVVKPEDEGPYGINNPRWWGRVKGLLSSKPQSLVDNVEALSEEFAYNLSQDLDFRVSPPTKKGRMFSRDFRGKKKEKTSSMQMFVEGAQPLNRYLQMPKIFDHLPRWANRFYLSRKKVQERVEKRLSPALLERMGVHNVVSGDIDCHLDNIMVKVQDPSSSPSKLAAIFEHEAAAKPADAEIQEIVLNIFQEGEYQKLLDHLFVWDDVEIGDEQRSIALIKPDGGASFPHRHAKRYRETRNKYFFEVLPQFKTETVTQDFADKTQGLFSVAEKVARRSMEHLLGAGKATEFWEAHKADIQKWTFSYEEDILSLHDRLVVDAVDLALRDRADYDKLSIKKKNKMRRRVSNYLDHHMLRTRNIIETMFQRWLIVSDHYDQTQTQQQSSALLATDPSEKKRTMRDLFAIRRSKQVKNEEKRIK